MPYWVARAVCEAREAAGVTRTEIAWRLGTNEHRIQRFELRYGYLHTVVDQYMVAYAEAIEAKTGERMDPRDFHRLAFELWMREGEPPRIEVDESPAPTPVTRAVDAARTARQATETSRDGSQRSHDATAAIRLVG